MFYLDVKARWSNIVELMIPTSIGQPYVSLPNCYALIASTILFSLTDQTQSMTVSILLIQYDDQTHAKVSTISLFQLVSTYKGNIKINSDRKIDILKYTRHRYTS